MLNLCASGTFLSYDFLPQFKILNYYRHLNLFSWRFLLYWPLDLTQQQKKEEKHEKIWTMSRPFFSLKNGDIGLIVLR